MSVTVTEKAAVLVKRNITERRSDVNSNFVFPVSVTATYSCHFWAFVPLKRLMSSLTAHYQEPRGFQPHDLNLLALHPVSLSFQTIKNV